MNHPDLGDLGHRASATAAANKQFIGVTLVVLLVMAFAPGSPARSLLGDIVSSEPAPAVDQAAPSPSTDPPPTPSSAPAPPAPAPPGPDLAAASEDLVERFEPGSIPPAEPLPPDPPCSTDDVTDALSSVRGQLSEALGATLPGAALTDLAEIAAGCSDEDPTGPTLDLALELAELVPDPGLETIDLPDLPGIDLPVPPELVELLGPVEEPITTACENLALVALLFVVLPPAFHAPVGTGDLVQLLSPASALCALFDEAPT